jgi:hypothetical protein
MIDVIVSVAFGPSFTSCLSDQSLGSLFITDDVVFVGVTTIDHIFHHTDHPADHHPNHHDGTILYTVNILVHVKLHHVDHTIL